MTITSTHTYRDRSTWPTGPWDAEPDHVQWRDPATGLPCLAHRNPYGAWCGYVGLPPDHPWHGVDYNECLTACGETLCEHEPQMLVDVHGGLTYSGRCQDAPEGEGICHVPAPGEPADVFWFGFDTNHAFDFAPGFRSKAGTYRDVDYVTREVTSLAAQLAEVAT